MWYKNYFKELKNINVNNVIFTEVYTNKIYIYMYCKVTLFITFSGAKENPFPLAFLLLLQHSQLRSDVASFKLDVKEKQ